MGYRDSWEEGREDRIEGHKWTFVELYGEDEHFKSNEYDSSGK